MPLNWLDRAISVFAPEAAFRRATFRDVLAEYEGGKTSRIRRALQEQRSPNHLVERNGARLRNWAREQERNLDLASGALDVLERNIVGPAGIGIEPMPRLRDGRVHQQFADVLMLLWADFCRRPEVTWTRDFASCERQTCRTWLRDGEAFAQTVEGLSPRIDHGTRVPLSLELLEPDLVPLDFEDVARGIRQGVETNAWGRPRAYHLYLQHPADSLLPGFADLKRVPAERMLHVALRTRLHQLRGISIFASVINRLEDIKEYEDDERLAARIAARLTALIKRDPEATGNLSADKSESGQPLMKIDPGTIYDGAAPGDEITMVDSKRPSAQVEPFRNGQLRAAASGLRTSYSSLSKNYDGTYSAQRQELVEAWPQYQCLTREFVMMFTRPVWERFVGLAILANQIRLPADLDPASLMAAEFIGPPMPWIDPMKEAQANRLRVRTGEKSLTQIIRERGGNPWQTIDQISDERAYANQRGIQLESDPAHDAPNTVAPVAPEPDDDDAPPPAPVQDRRRAA